MNPKRFSHLKVWIAENQSKSPAPEKRSWLPRYHGSREATVVLFLGLFKQPWNLWEEVERIRDSAYFQEYQGGWEQVQVILEQVTTRQEIEKIVTILGTEHDFFGNFLDSCEELLRREDKRFLPIDRDTHRKPKRILRRRGYLDKGSLRPQTLKGSFPPDPSPKPDRREKVQYFHFYLSPEKIKSS